ncbi:cell envelope integrity protein TolA [Vibrio metschnikovii]|uniref:cell envelope integrity protein TolA n=1 Tax=Vibrio metschnikovii TaxID=28172 RepID=UPI001C30D084|nr:cell envelope integrity protein TolA [Vibrio metschnikovii]
MKAKKTLQRADKKPWLISAALHVVLVVVLFWGADFTQSKPETPSAGAMMQAVVIDPSLIQQQAQQIRNQREAAAKQEQERLDKLRRETEQLERNRKAEEERIRQLKEQQAREAQATREAERVRQQQEQQRQAAEEKARQEQERAAKAEAQRKATEQAAKKAEAERVAREAAAAKAEQERVAREKAAQAAQEKARQEQEAAMNSIFSGLESEAQSISAARSQHIANEAQRWGAIYTQMIQQNLLLEDSFRGRQCRVNLRLIPTGADAIVGDVQVLNGDNRLCAATKRAVAKVGSFPLPTADEKDLIERLKNINLTVAPE